MTATEKKILGIERKSVEHFNRGEIGKVLGCFDSGFFGFSSTQHRRITGRKALRKTFDYYLGEARRLEFHISEPRAKVFGEAAIATFYWEVRLKDGRRVRRIKGRGTHVFVSRKGEWKIVHEHFSKAQ